MPRKTGGSSSEPAIRVTTLTATDAGLTEPVVVMELASHPGWEVVATVDVDRSALQGLSVQPAGKWLASSGLDGPTVARPSGVLTARMLRSLPIGEITTVATGAIRNWAADSIAQRQWLGPSGWPNLDREVDTWHRSLSTRPGRRGRPDTAYLRIVLAYLARIDEGDGRPVATIAETFHLSPSTVRNLLYEARNRRGLLTASAPGRPGGALTPKARELLEAQTKEMTDGER